MGPWAPCQSSCRSRSAFRSAALNANALSGALACGAVLNIEALRTRLRSGQANLFVCWRMCVCNTHAHGLSARVSHARVWQFVVAGRSVGQRWLSYRTRLGSRNTQRSGNAARTRLSGHAHDSPEFHAHPSRGQVDIWRLPRRLTRWNSEWRLNLAFARRCARTRSATRRCRCSAYFWNALVCLVGVRVCWCV